MRKEGKQMRSGSPARRRLTPALLVMAMVAALLPLGQAATAATNTALQFNGTAAQNLRLGTTSPNTSLRLSQFTLETWFRRTGQGDLPGATVIGGNAADPVFTRRVAAGAKTVYFCLNAMNYDCWADEFPPLQRGVLAGAEAAGARLVVLDNLYAYGPTNGKDLVESMPARPTSTKAARGSNSGNLLMSIPQYVTSKKCLAVSPIAF